MSDTTASLRRKINSAGDLQSVVRTMKALAASSIGQYEQSVRALGDYYGTVELGLGVCFRSTGSATWMTGETEPTEADAGLPLRGLFPVPNSVQAITPLVGQGSSPSRRRQSSSSGSSR